VLDRRETEELAALLESNPVDRINAARHDVEYSAHRETEKRKAHKRDMAALAARHFREWFWLLICLGAAALFSIIHLLVDRGYI